MPDKINSVPSLMRAITERLGMMPQETVNVTAPRPLAVFVDGIPTTYGVPKLGSGLMERITLGDATHPPTGVHMAPISRREPVHGTNLPPVANDAWEEARKRWPFVARYVSEVKASPKAGAGEAWFNKGDKSITIGPDAAKLDRDTLMQYLAHELVHAGQQNNFPSGLKGTIAYENFGPLNYWGQLGEEQAYSTMFDVTAKGGRPK